MNFLVVRASCPEIEDQATPARVLPAKPQGISKEEAARAVKLHPTGSGLTTPQRPAQGGYGIWTSLDANTLGLSDGLVRTINHWVGRYSAFAQDLPYGYKPEDCVEFPLDSFNVEGQFIAEAIARSLDDSWLVIFTPIERDKFLHVSRLMDSHGDLYNATPRLEAWGDGTPVLRDRLGEGFPGRWVRFMFDHCSTCLWDASACEEMLEALPLSPDVAAALEAEINTLSDAWEDWDFKDSVRPEFTAEFIGQRKALADAGLAMALKIKAALPDDWTVVYLDIERAARRGLRSEFEYRI